MKPIGRDDINKIWIKSDQKGIRAVEIFGFRELKLMDAPNEMHIEGFRRWVNLLFAMLGIDNSDGKRLEGISEDIEDTGEVNG